MDRVLVDSLKKAITQKLTDSLSVSPEFASDEMYYRAVALVLRDRLAQKERAFAAQSNANGKKRVSYLCMEFLLGRSLKNNLYNLELVEPMAQALSEFGVSLEKLYDQEPDAGLGNGGLGRLAACFLDALATCGYPGTGYCILYEFGIFRQKIIDGWQTELPDRWLPGGEVWLTPRPEQAVEVRFGGTIEETWEDNYHLVTHKNYQSVQAVPYDLYVSGYQSKGVSILRLWSAKSPSSTFCARPPLRILCAPTCRPMGPWTILRRKMPSTSTIPIRPSPSRSLCGCCWMTAATGGNRPGASYTAPLPTPTTR